MSEQFQERRQMVIDPYRCEQYFGKVDSLMLDVERLKLQTASHDVDVKDHDNDIKIVKDVVNEIKHMAEASKTAAAEQKVFNEAMAKALKESQIFQMKAIGALMVIVPLLSFFLPIMFNHFAGGVK